MKKIIKFASLLLSFMILMGLCACNTQNKKPDDTTTTSIPETTQDTQQDPEETTSFPDESSQIPEETTPVNTDVYKYTAFRPCFIVDGQETTDVVEIGTYAIADGGFATVGPEVKYDTHYVKISGEYEANTLGEHVITFSLKSPASRCWEGTEDTEDIQLTWIAVESKCEHANTETKNYKEAMKITNGYSGDVYCLDCGALVSQGEIIPYLGTTELKYELKDDGTYACTGLTTTIDSDIVIAAVYNGKPVTSIASMAFSGQKKIKSVTISENIEVIEDYAFANCNKLENITFHSTKLRYIGLSAFGFCGFKSVELPENLKELGMSVFACCETLETVVINEGVEIFGNEVFFECPNLKSITIPSTVKEVGTEIFNNCPSLKTIKYNGTKAQWEALTAKCFKSSFASVNVIFAN